MIPVANRFHGRGGIKYVYGKGQAYRSSMLVIKAVPGNRRKNSRIAVVVSRKIFKSAVKRNRIRRRIYEHMRLMLPQIKIPHDIVMVVTSKELLDIPHDEMVDQINKLLGQAKILDDRKN